MSSECAGGQDLVAGSGIRLHENHTSFRKAAARISNMTGIITYGNVPGAACRDSFLMAQAHLKEAILSELKEVYCKDANSLRAVEKWTIAFDGGHTELVDLPGSGRARDTRKVDGLRALIKGEGY
jgi:hypothetical protein